MPSDCISGSAGNVSARCLTMRCGLMDGLAPRPITIRRSADGPLLSLLHWQRMHQSALCPESIQPARQLQGTLRTDSAVIDFTVIADDRDDLCGPIVRPEAKRTTGGPIDAKQPLHHWILAVALCCDIRLGDPPRFSLDQRIAPVGRSISKLSSRSPIVASASPGPRSVCRPFGPLNAAL